jgi:hypothetical protein
MADEPADGSDDDAASDSIVWESVDSDDESDQTVGETELVDPSPADEPESGADEETDDDAREAARTDDTADTEDGTDLQALIAEDPDGDDEPSDDSAGAVDRGTGESDASGPSSADVGDETPDPGTAGDGPPDEESGTEPSGEGRSGRPGSDSGRLWNRFGDGEDTGESSEGGQSRQSTPGPKGSEPAGQESADTDAGGASADTADSDRLWNRHGGSGGQEGANTASTGGDTTSRGGDSGPDGGAETAAGDESGGGSSFDHLLERSGGGSGNPRPVGSPSVQTDLEAFFDDLDEFDRATSGSQVLVISPRDHEISDDVCSQFLTAGDVSRRNVLYVTTKQPASERLQICQGNDDWVGGKVGVVEMGDTGTSRDADLGSIAGEEIVHKRVSSPKNLSKAGLLITQTLKKWSGSDQPSILCFHTLTGISGYVQNETLFQFLFTLQAKLNQFGVTGHYHMDASRHDQQEVNTLKTLFDLVVTVSADGDIEVE